MSWIRNNEWLSTAALQTFDLVATDMGLAGYAIGTDDSERFCRAAGTERFRESRVGELVLGGGEP